MGWNQDGMNHQTNWNEQGGKWPNMQGLVIPTFIMAFSFFYLDGNKIAQIKVDQDRGSVHPEDVVILVHVSVVVLITAVVVADHEEDFNREHPKTIHDLHPSSTQKEVTDSEAAVEAAIEAAVILVKGKFNFFIILFGTMIFRGARGMGRGGRGRGGGQW